MGRLQAVLKRCRKKGGDCHCHEFWDGKIGCKAESLLNDERDILMGKRQAIDAAIKSIDRKMAWLLHEPCTVKEGWEMPPKPQGEYEATVVSEDGWHPHWYSETEDIDYIEFPSTHSWPFVEDRAYDEDWEKLGFVVV